jgi:adenine-specific DNA-methyltransferase
MPTHDGQRDDDAPEKIRDRARRLRQTSTVTEKLLWSLLRNRSLCGLKFRRQYPIPPYVVDFCCFDEKLIVEVDGDSHAQRERSDAARTNYLSRQGYRVIRFTNEDVLSNLEGVAAAIARATGKSLPEFLPSIAPQSSPLPLGEG